MIFTPPQNFEDIEKLLINLEQYINEANDIDPLIIWQSYIFSLKQYILFMMVMEEQEE